jgi:putative glutathione S-transferase
MIDGVWKAAWRPADEQPDGRFVREDASYRDPLPPGPVAPGRYHLFVAWTCPWAHRTLLARSLKGLQGLLPVHHFDEFSDKSWRSPSGPEPLYGHEYLYELYLRADARHTGRVTVPVLWDAHEQRIVNNESAEILRMLDALPSDAPRLCPDELRADIDAMNERLYAPLNNGVYRAGFASTQGEYDAAVADVFGTLDHLEGALAGREWLVGDRLTEADLRLFVTLFRFDAAYYTLFKCNLRRVAEYPNLQAHLRRVYHHPGVAETCNLEAAKRGYASIRAVNPHGIVPVGPIVSL